MKKLFFGFSLFLVVFFCPVAGNTMDLTAGVTSWYSMWDMETKTPEGTDKNSPENTFMAGPALGLRFYNNWKFGAQFYFGKMTNHVSETEIDGADVNYDKSKQKYFRYDSDFTLGYQWKPWLTTFAGYKYFGYDVTESHVSYTNGVFSGTRKDEGRRTTHGFGLGAGTNFEVYGNIYFSFNGSCLYLKGELPETIKSYDTAGVLTEREKINWDIEGWGFNGTAAFSYYLSNISTSFSLGFRYQYLDYDMEISDGSIEMKDQFYGLTFTAVYFIPDI